MFSFVKSRLFVLPLLVLPLSVAFVACGGDDDDDAAPAGGAETVAPDEKGKTSYSTYADDERTGVAGVDAVIERVQKGESLNDLLGYARVSCGITTASGSGEPPECLPGEGVGTVIEVLATQRCEQKVYTRPADLAALEAELFEGNPDLFAVYKPGEKDGTEPFPAGEYAVVFVNANDEGRVVHVKDDQVVRVALSCDGEGPESLVEGQTDFVLDAQQ